LVSIGKLNDHRFMAMFADGKCTIYAPGGELVGESVSSNGKTPRPMVREKATVGEAAALETVMLDQLHRRMGHISPWVACHMGAKGFATRVRLENDRPQDIFCESCVYAKAMRKPVPKEGQEGSRAKVFGEEVHSDLWDPAPVQSLRGKHYYVSFIDN
ncbi:hypothetical protein BDP27DRAFT_1173274, partial [Rhodocollybia butyracea]